MNERPQNLLNLKTGKWILIFAIGFFLGLIVDYESYPALVMTGLLRAFPLLEYLWWIVIPVVTGSFSVFFVVIWKMLGKPNVE